ncbi:hypothetical protein GCK32_017943, partial [Trichostrongylus colubriformis]
MFGGSRRKRFVSSSSDTNKSSKSRRSFRADVSQRSQRSRRDYSQRSELSQRSLMEDETCMETRDTSRRDVKSVSRTPSSAHERSQVYRFVKRTMEKGVRGLKTEFLCMK